MNAIPDPNTPDTPKRKRRMRELTPLAYRINDAADAIGMSAAKLWELIAEGRIPTYKITAGITVIRREDLIALLDASPRN